MFPLLKKPTEEQQKSAALSWVDDEINSGKTADQIWCQIEEDGSIFDKAAAERLYDLGFKHPLDIASIQAPLSAGMTH